MFIRLIAALAALTLAACGGGGGGSSIDNDAQVPTSDIDPNLAYVGDVLIYAGGQRFVADVTCNGFDCQISLAGETESFSIYDFDPTGPEVALGNRTTFNGVNMARATADDDTGSYDFYAGWAEHSAFFAATATTVDDGITIDLVMPFSMGNGTETAPTAGSATWNGAMLGTRYAATYLGRDVIGEAQLTMDFTRMSVDVSFTEIQERGTNTALPDMSWDNLSVDRSGEFHGTGLDGTFYGPNHEEAGGIFDRNSIIGAFGAVRE